MENVFTELQRENWVFIFKLVEADLTTKLIHFFFFLKVSNSLQFLLFLLLYCSYKLQRLGLFNHYILITIKFFSCQLLRKLDALKLLLWLFVVMLVFFCFKVWHSLVLFMMLLANLELLQYSFTFKLHAFFGNFAWWIWSYYILTTVVFKSKLPRGHLFISQRLELFNLFIILFWFWCCVYNDLF